ncbi:MAG: DedA family protein [Hyphomicrobiales bacterium]|nr:DedA family protein [Hyphomicrobiales bacterium]
MLRRLYDWVMGLAAHRNATWVLAAVAFIESSVFPIPPDAMLIPMALADRRKAWLYAMVATVASVLGGIIGYLIGYFLYDTVGQAILEFYGKMDKFESFTAKYNEYGAAIVFFAGLTPFPYKVITIASGVTKMAVPVFIAASVVSRGLRFFLVCGLLYWFGPPIKDFIEKYLGWLTLIFGILLVGGFIAIRYVW